MNAALILLSRYRFRGFARRFGRTFATVRGAVVGVVIVVGFLLGVGTNAAMALYGDRTPPEQVRLIAPFAIAGLVLLQLVTTAADKVLAFTAAEVDFLFPGPFSQRQLVLYNLMSGVAGAGLTALIFSLLFLRWSTWWIAGWLGLWLAFLFIRLFSAALALGFAAIGSRGAAIVRGAIMLIVVAFGVQGIVEATAGSSHQSAEQVAARFRASQGGTIVLAPFEPFGRAIAAERILPDFALWGGISAAMVALMIAVVLRANASYLEAAVIASERRYEMLQRLSRGRAPAIGMKHTARWRVPMFPWLGGAGPIAWRQATELLRGSPRAFVSLALMAVGVVPFMLMGNTNRESLAGPAFGMTVWLSFMVTAIVPLGFRADLDYMDWLKTAPIRPLAIAVGELLPAVLFVSLLQSVMLSIMAGAGIAPAGMLLAGLAFTLPANLLLLSAENVLFLWMPTRVAVSPGDLQFMGRQMVMMMVRMLMVGAAIGVAAMYVGIAYVLGVTSPIAMGAIAWVVLMFEGAGGLLIVARAFRKFDPSMDMPV